MFPEDTGGLEFLLDRPLSLDVTDDTTSIDERENTLIDMYTIIYNCVKNHMDITDGENVEKIIINCTSTTDIEYTCKRIIEVSLNTPTTSVNKLVELIYNGILNRPASDKLKLFLALK